MFSTKKEATGYTEIVIVAIFSDSRILQKNIKLNGLFEKIFYTKFEIDFQKFKLLK